MKEHIKTIRKRLRNTLWIGLYNVPSDLRDTFDEIMNMELEEKFPTPIGFEYTKQKDGKIIHPVLLPLYATIRGGLLEGIDIASLKKKDKVPFIEMITESSNIDCNLDPYMYAYRRYKFNNIKAVWKIENDSDLYEESNA